MDTNVQGIVSGQRQLDMQLVAPSRLSPKLMKHFLWYNAAPYSDHQVIDPTSH